MECARGWEWPGGIDKAELTVSTDCRDEDYFGPVPDLTAEVKLVGQWGR